MKPLLEVTVGELLKESTKSLGIKKRLSTLNKIFAIRTQSFIKKPLELQRHF